MKSRQKGTTLLASYQAKVMKVGSWNPRGHGQGGLRAWTPQNFGHRNGRVGKREVTWTMANVLPLAATSLSASDPLATALLRHISSTRGWDHLAKWESYHPHTLCLLFMSVCLWFLSLPTQISLHSQALPRPQQFHYYFGLCPWLWPYLLTMSFFTFLEDVMAESGPRFQHKQ